MIIVDAREKRSLIPKQLETFKIPLTYSVLEVGDYVVCGKENVCVSRKNSADYVSSLTSGHLNQELYDLSTNYPYSIFIFEGFVTEALMYRRLKRYTYYSSLVGTALKRSPDGAGGIIHFIPADMPFDTALILKFIHDKVTTEGGLLRTPVLNAVHWKPKDRQIGIMSSFPKIGSVKAKALLTKFKTLKAVSDAQVKELCEVSGVGPKLAQAIYDMWRREI